MRASAGFKLGSIAGIRSVGPVFRPAICGWVPGPPKCASTFSSGCHTVALNFLMVLGLSVLAGSCWYWFDLILLHLYRLVLPPPQVRQGGEMFSATRCAVLLVVLSHASLSVSVRAPSSPRVPGVRVCVRHTVRSRQASARSRSSASRLSVPRRVGEASPRAPPSCRFRQRTCAILSPCFLTLVPRILIGREVAQAW